MSDLRNLLSAPGRGLRLVLLGSCLLALAGCTRVSLLVANTWARFGDYSVASDIPYGPDPLNQLDIYTPAGTPGDLPRPTVVFFYGGCWGGCDTVTRESYRFVAEALTSENFVAVMADYRRHPQVKFRQIMADTGAAVSWVAQHIGDYGGDSSRIYLMGHSAGAHLAAMLTLNESYLREDIYRSISGFIGLAGPYDFLPFTEDYQRTLFGPEENYPASQPINFVDGTEPPMLLLHGQADTVVKQKNLINLAAKAQSLQGRVETRLYPEVGHAGILAALSRPLRSRYQVLADISGFIRSGPAVAVTTSQKGPRDDLGSYRAKIRRQQTGKARPQTGVPE